MENLKRKEEFVTLFINNARIIPRPSEDTNYGFLDMPEKIASIIVNQKIITVHQRRLTVKYAFGKPSERSQKIEICKEKRRRYKARKDERKRAIDESLNFTNKRD